MLLMLCKSSSKEFCHQSIKIAFFKNTYSSFHVHDVWKQCPILQLQLLPKMNPACHARCSSLRTSILWNETSWIFRRSCNLSMRSGIMAQNDLGRFRMIKSLFVFAIFFIFSSNMLPKCFRSALCRVIFNICLCRSVVRDCSDPKRQPVVPPFQEYQKHTKRTGGGSKTNDWTTFFPSSNQGPTESILR